MALRLSSIGILDRENALICGVSIAAIRHWRSGRRRSAYGPGAERRRQCPRCHARSMDEQAYAYLLGLYLGDGSITRGRRDVFALWIACCDDWPGLLAACRQAMSDVMPASSVFCVHYQGCTMVKSTSKHWPCLFPQHGPGRKHTRKIELESWQSAIVQEYPGEFARGLFHSDGWRGVNRVRRRLSDGDRWYEYPLIFLAMSPRTFSGCAGRRWTGSGWPGGSRGGTRYRWRAGKRWRGWMSSWGPSTDAVRVFPAQGRGSGPR
jgi:hypothetical protein